MKKNESEIRMIDGYPVLIPLPKVAQPRLTRRKKRKPPMAELGFEKLKPREKQALINKFELGMPNKMAALDAGYPESRATHALPELLRRKPILDALEKHGVTDDKIGRRISEGLDAMHPMKPAQPDQIARRQFVSEANKIKNNYPTKRIEVDERRVIVNLGPEDMIALRKYQKDRGEI